MQEFDQLITLLDQPDDEIWGNIWMNDAITLFQRSHTSLIPLILKVWQQWPSNRQEHLAVILGSVGSEQEALLIKEMLNTYDPHIRRRAQEALEEWFMSVHINQAKNV